MFSHSLQVRGNWHHVREGDPCSKQEVWAAVNELMSKCEKNSSWKHSINNSWILKYKISILFYQCFKNSPGSMAKSKLSPKNLVKNANVWHTEEHHRCLQTKGQPSKCWTWVRKEHGQKGDEDMASSHFHGKGKPHRGLLGLRPWSVQAQKAF